VEDAPPLPESMLREAPTSRFYVKSSGFAASKLVKRISNVGLRIRRLHQRYGGGLKSGQYRSVQNIFYNDTDHEPKDYDVRRIASASALILKAGKPYGLYTARPKELRLPALRSNAAALYLAADRLALLDLTSLDTIGLRTDQPVSIEIDLRAVEATVYATKKCELTIGSSRITVKPGMNALEWRWPGLLAKLKRAGAVAIADASGRTRTPPTQHTSQVTQRGLREVWRLPAAKQDDAQFPDEVNAIQPADLDGDGTDEILLLRGSRLLCLAHDGKTRWEFETEGAVRAVCAADLNGDGRPEVLLGSDDERLYVLSAGGRELRRTVVDVLLRVGTSSVRRPRVANVAVDDIDGDGKPDIIVGTLNGNIVRYDTDLNKLWNFDRVEHGTRETQLVDLDGDGVKEILAANKYGAVEAVSAAGSPMRGAYSELGDVEFDVADMTGDGKYEIVNGSSTGALTITTWGQRARGTFPNYGYGARDVRMADVDGDGKPDALVASETGYVYVLDADCNLKARAKLADSVLTLSPVFAPGRRATEVFAGCADGTLHSLGGNMKIRRQASVGFPIEVSALATSGSSLRVIVAGEGQVAALSVE